jgi:LmbE family N-acetylglucosaminyl deacetylase
MADAPAHRVQFICAHPDDGEIRCGGSAALWAQAGAAVQIVSLTAGGAGHHEMPTAALCARRRTEAQAAATVLGAESRVLDFPDGAVEPSLAARTTVITCIREFAPDLVITHRPNDYHPDHRATSELVQDASYLVAVPKVVPDAPALQRLPAFAYCEDAFTKPYPFTASFAVAIDAATDRKARAVHAHASQFYEWLPWIGAHGFTDPPADDEARLAWLGERLAASAGATAERWQPLLPPATQYAEAYERCEYGGPLPEQLVAWLCGQSATGPKVSSAPP